MTRSQNVRNPESTSHGIVAQNRYKGIAQRGHFGVLGQGWTTGHQNIRPAPIKEACSSLCNQSHRNASSNSEGTCHPTNARVATTQQIAGFEISGPNRLTKGNRRNGLTTLRAIDCGSPRRNGNAGAPSRIKGGATALSSRCCTMWTVSEASSNATSGEPIAIQTATTPAKKAARRQRGNWCANTVR